MEMDKLMRWRELTEKFYGDDFWSWIFDSPNSKQKSASIDNPMKVNTHENSQFPLIDMFINNNEVLVMIELPGINKEDVQLAISGDILRVKGKIKEINVENQILKERYVGPFEKSIKLPETVVEEKSTAKFANGILHVRLPLKNAFNTKKINID